MKGQLDQHPLAELIREISTAGLSGSLRLERELARAAVYFEAGEVSYAVSNVRALRLKECLRRWRAVSEKQLADAGEHDADMKLAQALVHARVVTRERVDELLMRQAGEVLRLALLWTEGSWNFDPRVSLAEQIGGKLELGQLLLESTRRLPPEFAASRFPSDKEMLSPSSAGPENLALQPMEAFVLSRVDAQMSVGELKAISGLPETESMRALYTLALGGFLGRESWPRAFRDDEINRALAIKASREQSAAKGAASAAAPEKEEKSPSETAAQTAARTKEEEQRELDELFARLSQAKDYYQVLGISRQAELSEIKRTYHSLAKRFHPDRFHQEASLRLKIEDAFAKIAQAYETLRDKRSRAAYDYKIEGR